MQVKIDINASLGICPSEYLRQPCDKTTACAKDEGYYVKEDASHELFLKYNYWNLNILFENKSQLTGNVGFWMMIYFYFRRSFIKSSGSFP